jgi:hypothetical protein
MNFSIDCCCNRKNKKSYKMSNLRKEESIIFADNLSDIYELVMTPCENSPEMPETLYPMLTLPPVVPSPKRKNVYINFFEDNSPVTPRTPDANSNTFHVMIPKNSDLYVNYEKFNNFI